MKIKQNLLLLLLLCALVTGLRAESSGVETIQIAAYDTLIYSVKKIEVRPGQKLVVVVTNKGTMAKNIMAHNWVLLKAGISADAYAKAALNANELQPKALSGEVIASVPALGPNESGTATFSAPLATGTYPYLCTAVGHTVGASAMRGVLIVK